jgi:glycosyltransferase involved in cell wall biosynthesis
MHIIVLEQYPSSRRGGQGIVLFEVCRLLAARGHRITLLYTQEDNLLSDYRKFSTLIKLNKFIVSRPQDVLNFLADIRNINQQLISEDSIILSNEVPNIPFGYLLSKSKNIPLLCYLHYTPEPSLWTAFCQSKGLQRWKTLIVGTLHRWQIYPAMTGVKRFIAVSQQTKSNWVDSKGSNLDKIIDVVHNGVDLDIYKPASGNISKETKVISYIGRLDKEKGLETLLRAFSLLLKGTNAQLLIAGKPVADNEDYQQSLILLSLDLGIEKFVKFLGHVSDTIDIYQKSDITVLPSQWPEPFGRVIIESMACGTPVIASSIGGIPEVLTGEFQDFLFAPGNETQLSNTLRKIIDWRNQQPELAHKCRQHIISKFSLLNTVDAVEKILINQINSPNISIKTEDKYGTT